MIVSFELTMPNRGSWNGRWSGEDSKYYIIRTFRKAELQNKPHFYDLLKDGKDGWYYGWGDGWGANVKAEIIDSRESTKRRRVSKGFCGYDWMVSSIIREGKIIS